MGSGLFGTNLLKGNGFFGFDPTPTYSLTGTAKNASSGSFTPAPDSNYVAPTSTQPKSNGTVTTDGAQVGVNGATGSGYSSTGGTRATVGDPAAILEAQDLINQAQASLSRIQGQTQVGNENITNAFSTARAGLTGDKNRVTRDYNDSRNSTITQNQAAKARIDGQVRSRASALQRFLGAGGAGDSEAALKLAPYAAARTGTQLRSQVNDAYSQNMQGLDKSFGDFNQDFDNSWGSLEAQEKDKRNSLQAQMLQAQMDGQDQLRRGQGALAYAKTGNVAEAQRLRSQALPMMFQILQQIDQLSKQAVNPNVQTAAYDAPDLQSYQTNALDAVGGGADGVDPAQSSDIAGAYQYLLKKQAEDQQAFGY